MTYFSLLLSKKIVFAALHLSEKVLDRFRGYLWRFQFSVDQNVGIFMMSFLTAVNQLWKRTCTEPLHFGGRPASLFFLTPQVVIKIPRYYKYCLQLSGIYNSSFLMDCCTGRLKVDALEGTK